MINLISLLVNIMLLTYKDADDLHEKLTLVQFTLSSQKGKEPSLSQRHNI